MNNGEEKECVFCVHFVHFVTTFSEHAWILTLRASFCTRFVWLVTTFVHSLFFVIFRYFAVKVWCDTDTTGALQRNFRSKHMPKIGKKCPQIV